MKTRKLISILLSLCLIIASVSIASFNVYADDTVYTSQDGLWSYRILNNGTAEIYSESGTAYFGDERDVTIPETIDGLNVTGIGDYAFTYMENLQSVTIHEGISSIGQVVFGGCANLQSIIVSENNLDYLSDDGVLFNKSKTNLICYPSGKSSSLYVVPETVEHIEDDAFVMNSYIEHITMSDGLLSIGIEAFAMCTALNCVDIPSTCISINSGAFAYCSSLQQIAINGEITRISESCFYGCSLLQEITLPRSVEAIDDDAFVETSLTTIKGYYDTVAESFANDNGYTFIPLDTIVPGDLSGDEAVTLVDYTMLCKYISGEVDISGTAQKLSADVDSDGAIDAFDLFCVDKIINTI